MIEHAAPIEFLRVGLVLVAAGVNVSAIVEANRDLRYVLPDHDPALLIIARRNLRREYLRSTKQGIILVVALLELTFGGDASAPMRVAAIAMMVLSAMIAGESMWERRERRFLTDRVASAIFRRKKA